MGKTFRSNSGFNKFGKRDRIPKNKLSKNIHKKGTKKHGSLDDVPTSVYDDIGNPNLDEF